jgi:hypothetical protein
VGNLGICSTCKSYGVVRAAGPKAGRAYKTPEGAAQAASSVPCPDCTRTHGLRSSLRPRSQRT